MNAFDRFIETTDTEELTRQCGLYASDSPQSVSLQHAVRDRKAAADAIARIADSGRWQEIRGLSFAAVDDIPTATGNE